MKDPDRQKTKWRQNWGKPYLRDLHPLVDINAHFSYSEKSKNLGATELDLKAHLKK